jgi:Tol biopolymer transport system component
MAARFILIGAAMIGTGALLPQTAVAAPTTIRVSVSSAAGQSDRGSGVGTVAMSANGRFVAFVSGASNLVPGDGNGVLDVFVRDTASNTTERVSVSSTEVEGNGLSSSHALAISPNGRYVTFTSYATNLAPGNDDSTCDPERCPDVFIRDRTAGTTRMLVPFTLFAVDRLALSAGARWYAYNDDLLTGVVRCKRSTQHCVEASVLPPPIKLDEIDANSILGGISRNGRYVFFFKAGGPLPPNTISNGLFIRDMTAGRTRIVTTRPFAAANALSADGDVSLFSSGSKKFVRHDTNGKLDVFVKNRVTGAVHRVSVSSSEHQANGPSSGIAISTDGRYCLFSSTATNLVAGDTNGRADIFVRDRVLGTTIRVDVSATGAQANGNVGPAALASDGHSVAFQSFASNLVAGDTNGFRDVFVREPLH